jgi:hypothetical protein
MADKGGRAGMVVQEEQEAQGGPADLDSMTGATVRLAERVARARLAAAAAGRAAPWRPWREASPAR